MRCIYILLIAVLFSFRMFAQEANPLPLFNQQHVVVPFAYGTVNSTSDGVVHHFDGHELPSMVYLEEDDPEVYVVHQDMPFNWQRDTLSLSPPRDFRRFEYTNNAWYFLSHNPTEISRKEDLLSEAAPELILSTALAIDRFRVGDVDGDGELEIVTVTGSANSPLLIWESTGSTYVPADTIAFVTYTGSLDLYDFNGDGYLDAVSDGKIYLSEGPSNWNMVHDFSAFSRSTELADFDGDGDMDIASVDYYGTHWTLTYYHGGSDFETTAAEMFPGNGPLYASDLTSADVNGDGAIDVAIGLGTNDNIYLWLNGIDAMESPTVLVPDGNPGRGNLTLHDLDLDGDLDLFGTNPYRYVVTTENTQINLGCTDELACNYNPEANQDDDSCEFAPAFADCDGVCFNDTNANGVCDEFELYGCTDDSACNYDSDVVFDDGSCQTDGCNDPEACNFDGADACNNACIYPAIGEDCAGIDGLCGPGTQWNPFSQQCEISLPGDLDLDGCVTVSDLLGLLSAFSMCNDEGANVFACGIESVQYGNEDYNTVSIGGQCWFAENLRTHHFDNGDAISLSTSSEDWIYHRLNALPTIAFPQYDSLSLSAGAIGLIYNGYAVNDNRGLCPVGWRVALDSDWQQLESNLGMLPSELSSTGWRGTDQGTKIKSSPSDNPAWDGTNESGLGLFNNSWVESNGTFHGQDAKYWAPTLDNVNGTPVMMRRQLRTGLSQIRREQSASGVGFPVRCIHE